MARYIDADEMYKKLHEAGGCDAEKGSFAHGWDKAIDEAISLLNGLPVADVVEVVRCKDCKHCKPSREYEDEFYCAFHSEDDEAEVSPNDFCSYGKKRRNENEQKTDTQ